MKNELEVILNIFTIEKGKIKILLLRKKTEPYKGYWVLPNEKLSTEETLEEKSDVVLDEQTGLSNVYLEQIKTFSALNRYPDKRIIGTSFLGLVDSVSIEIKREERLKIESEWFSIDAIPKLGYDHEEIIRNSIDYLRRKIVSTNVLKKLFPSDFTLPEIQKVYEQILGKQLDRRNFRKKFINLGLIEDTGYKNEGMNGRPAKLYKFREDIKERELF